MIAGDESVHELVGLYVLNAATLAEAAAFEAHLAVCDSCRAELAALRPIAAGLAETVPQIDPPARLRERVLRVAGGGAMRSDSRTSPSAAGRMARTRLAWSLAAASVVAAIALGGYSLELRRLQTSLERQLQQALTRAEAAEREVSDIRLTALGARSQLAVLTAPDVVRIDLAGQPNAPRASARAFWSRSSGMVFTASNLPSLGAGRVYQLWVLTAEGPPVGVGLLQPDQAGSLSAMFQTPADIPPPTGVAVSDEPAGGAPAPTGTIWVAGKASA